MQRPGMVALLAYLDAQKGRPYTVIFDDLKRFARDTEFHLKLRREFAKRGATIECLNFRIEDMPTTDAKRVDVKPKANLCHAQRSKTASPKS